MPSKSTDNFVSCEDIEFVPCENADQFPFIHFISSSSSSKFSYHGISVFNMTY